MTTRTRPPAPARRPVVMVWIEADRTTHAATLYIQRHITGFEYRAAAYPIQTLARQHRAFQTLMAWAKRNPIHL